MEEWKTYRLGDLCTIYGRIGFRGYTTEDLTTNPVEGAISLSPTNIVSGELDLSKPTYIKWNKYYESPEIMINAGDIIIVKTGSSVGRTTFIREVTHPMTLNPQLVVLKNIKTNPLFLSYLVKTREFQGALHSITVGSAIPTLSQKNLANLKVSIPSSKTQRRISDILDAIDEKILLNNRINHNLEEQAQALYKSWFVDFEPFKDGKFVDSELGMIPEGWRVGTLSELLDIRYGKDHKSLKDGSVPVYGSGGLMRFAEKALCERESVLIPRKGTLNNVMYSNHPFWTVDTMFYSFEKLPDAIKYCHQFLLTQDLASMNAGSAVPSMTTDILNALTLPIPTERVLRSFNVILSSLYLLYDHSRSETQSLSSLRDAVLPRLMSGHDSVAKATC